MVAVVVINPADALVAPPEKTVALGGPKFAWFRVLNLRVPSSSALGSLTFRNLHGQP